MPGTDPGDGKAGDSDHRPGSQKLAWLQGIKRVLLLGAASQEFRGVEAHLSPVGHRFWFPWGPGAFSNKIALQISLLGWHPHS